jgi:hypothetical protein
MTSIQQEYYKYLEQKRHDQQMEQLQAESNAIASKKSDRDFEVAKQNADTNARAQATSELMTKAQINQIANSIRQKDIELQMKGDMNNWQKTIDAFNANLSRQKQSLDKSKLDFEKDKWGQTQSNWLKEYDLKKGDYTLAKKNYDLAVKKFKNDKTQQTWANVLKTADTLGKLVNNLSGARVKGLAAAAKAMTKAAAK